MAHDPFNLREQRDSIDDANETGPYDPTTAEERDYLRRHYNRLYRQQRESAERWEREHPEIAQRVHELAEAARGDMPEPDPGLLDALFGDDDD